ncbi:hypothetical protein [Tunturiibacter gelidiferens]|uniref:hypothetical protein n=1 Tax=Tunturiibacter gelidiferens TaxID=3069689 RepID=UPI003D9B2AF3
MMSRSHIVAYNATLSVLLASFVLTGCHSSSKNSTPTVAFGKVAAAYQEDPYKIVITEGRDYKRDIMEGRVTGARPGQRIVLYAMTDGRWGVCRQSDLPFTNIEADGRWEASVHLGLQYAALLVDPTYNPPEQTESLPTVGNGVMALAVVNGEGPPPILPSPKILNFSGYEWTTSTGPIFHAGSRNFFDPANVWTDESGALHLRISGSPGKWAAAEVKLMRSLGYGTYSFHLRDVSHLEPSALLTLVAWDGVGTESARHELDVELGRWGDPENTNVNYVVQPYYVPANSVAFRVSPGAYTHSFHWEPGQVTFSTLAGSGNTGGRVLNRHVFTSGVPSPEGESVRIALYVFRQGKIPLKNENEVIIDKFEYLP